MPVSARCSVREPSCSLAIATSRPGCSTCCGSHEPPPPPHSFPCDSRRDGAPKQLFHFDIVGVSGQVERLIAPPQA